MRIILTGGGTAGHVNPAIAVADALCRVGRGSVSGKPEILFVGTARGLENGLVTEAGYPIWNIGIEGLKRSLTPKNIGVLLRAAGSLGEADRIIERFRPDAVFGTGGYVCFPLVYQASRKGIFTALHESNAAPGLAVRMLSGRVDRIYTNFSETEKELKAPSRAVRVGNPVRGEWLKMSRREARERLGLCEAGGVGEYRHVILSFGGSLGAETVNREMLRLMNGYVRAHPETLHVHASGRAGYADTVRAAEELNIRGLKNAVIKEFIRDMPLWIAAADIVICRAGATTLSELAAAGRASVLIPSPNVTGNHQYLNARAFGDTGAAFVVTERREELDRIEQLVSSVLSDRALRENMELCASRLAPEENAAERIARELLEYGERRG